MKFVIYAIIYVALAVILLWKIRPDDPQKKGESH